ncbi:MAG: universal stress protein [Deltaproteobacteria bacterium]|nr:universal stress protein [Deltaproteobacteria bacterium]
MEKKILIAVDQSIHSRKAIEYCIEMHSIIKNMSFVLINIQPKISDFLFHESESDQSTKEGLKEMADKNQKHSMKILGHAKNTMIKMGVSEKLIETASFPAIKGISKEILDYAKQIICDAIVVGNRGTTKLTEAFTHSITNNILEFTDTVPIWAVDGNVRAQNVMVAVDGSESSLAAVDHTAFMFSGNTSTDIMLLHVTPSLRDFCTIDFKKRSSKMEDIISKGDKQCIDSFYVRAQKIFTEAGLKKNQVHTIEVKNRISIGKTIVTQAKKHDCGTLVMGRRGTNNSFFIGSVSRYVITNAKGCAVWLVP